MKRCESLCLEAITKRETKEEKEEAMLYKKFFHTCHQFSFRFYNLYKLNLKSWLIILLIQFISKCRLTYNIYFQNLKWLVNFFSPKIFKLCLSLSLFSSWIQLMYLNAFNFALSK